MFQTIINNLQDVMLIGIMFALLFCFAGLAVGLAIGFEED